MTLLAVDSDATLIGPTEEQWRAMPAEERTAYLERVNAALSDIAIVMSEGRPHKKAKSRALDALGLYFRSLGRDVYLGEEMSVVYPGAAPFSPDLLAVIDVVEPEDDQRLAWVVADEGRGLDWVLEVLHHGDRHKDLVRNVERYAALGIPEYFVYDRRNDRILGHRLPSPSSRRYERIVPQHGRHTSRVLGLDLSLEGGRLRFFHGTAELIGSAELIDRLHRITTSLEAKADDFAARADMEAARADFALEVIRRGILSILAGRGIACADAQRARVAACADPVKLERWLLASATAATAADALGG